RSAARRAADRPAAPEPTTSRSNASDIGDSAEGKVFRRIDGRHGAQARGVPAQLAGAGTGDGSDEAVQLARSADFADAGALADGCQRARLEQRRERLAEVARVEAFEGGVEDGRVDRAELGEGELVGQELEGDPRVAQLGLNAIDGDAQHV